MSVYRSRGYESDHGYQNCSKYVILSMIENSVNDIRYNDIDIKTVLISYPPTRRI